jgi:integrase
MSLADAEQEAIQFLTQVQSGIPEETIKETKLKGLFEDYLRGERLKESTKKGYRYIVNHYLKDWLNKPVASITKQSVEERFYRIRDKGMYGSLPSYSQATKVMRVLSALMNYAMADELIESNPVNVLKYKRVDRSIRKRDRYLTAEQAKDLLTKTAKETHPITLAVHLILYTGLRKNEALRLKWSDIEHVNGVECLLIRDTKNKRPHYVPITPAIQRVINRASNDTSYLFPSPARNDFPASYARDTVRRLSKMIGADFTCHDLRRTFATRASEIGIDYATIKRLLNHKTNDITAQYIQWHSKANLLMMKKALESITY